MREGKGSGWTISSAAVMGVFIGAALTTIAVLVLRPQGLETWRVFANGWSRDFGPNFWAAAQTVTSIVGGAATLFAGWLAWSAAQAQIQAQTEAAKAQRHARLAAEFAMLPLTIDRFSATAVWHIHRWISGKPFSHEKPAPPGDEDFSVMKACIEASDGIVRQQLIDIVALYLVVFSEEVNIRFPPEGIGRLLERPRDAWWGGYVLSIYKWLSLSARCNCLRSYATGREATLTWERLVQELDGLVWTVCDYDQGPLGYLMINDAEFMEVFNGQKAQGHPLVREDWRRFYG